MRPNHLLTKLMLVVTVLVMTGVPAMAQAAAGQQQQNTTVDPSASPKMPSASTEQAPETTEPAAQESLPSAPTPSVQPAPQAQQQTQTQTPQQPDGTAAAQRAHTEGGPASKPAGMAIAPAKQKQTRSLLIKVGAVLAAGAAIGTVYALTRATPSTPPNTGAATTTAAAK